MRCYCCGLLLSNDPDRDNFGLWTVSENAGERLAYCADSVMCERFTLSTELNREDGL